MEFNTFVRLQDSEFKEQTWGGDLVAADDEEPQTAPISAPSVDIDPEDIYL